MNEKINIPNVNNLREWQEEYKHMGLHTTKKELLLHAIQLYRQACWDLPLLKKEAKKKLQQLNYQIGGKQHG